MERKYHRRAEGGEVREGEPWRRPAIGVAIRVRPRICRPPQRISIAALDIGDGEVRSVGRNTTPRWPHSMDFCRAIRYYGSLNNVKHCEVTIPTQPCSRLNPVPCLWHKRTVDGCVDAQLLKQRQPPQLLGEPATEVAVLLPLGLQRQAPEPRQTTDGGREAPRLSAEEAN